MFECVLLCYSAEIPLTGKLIAGRVGASKNLLQDMHQLLYRQTEYFDPCEYDALYEPLHSSLKALILDKSVIFNK